VPVVCDRDGLESGVGSDCAKQVPDMTANRFAADLKTAGVGPPASSPPTLGVVRRGLAEARITLRRDYGASGVPIATPGARRSAALCEVRSLCSPLFALMLAGSACPCAIAFIALLWYGAALGTGTRPLS
jgi:hypothetical protein